MSLKAKIEAVIYASEEPVTLAQLTGLLGEEAQAELDALEAQQSSLPLDVELPADSDADKDDEYALNAETLGEAEAPIDTEAATSEGETPETADTVAETATNGAEQEPAQKTTVEGDATPVSAEETPAPVQDEKELARQAAASSKARERKLREYFRSLLDQLIADYVNNDRGMEIREVAGGFRLATKPEYHDAVRGFVKSLKPPLKLSLQALETLAVVAYKQPVTAPEVSEIRGVDSGGVLGSLMTRKLVTTAGRKQVIGRPILYKTTKEFLVRFGLKDINELPSIEEFEKMAGEFAESEPVQEEIPMDAPNGNRSEESVASGGSPAVNEIDSVPQPTHVFHESVEDLESDKSSSPEGADTEPPVQHSEETSGYGKAEEENVEPNANVHEPQADGDDRNLDVADRVIVDGRISGLPPSDNTDDNPSAEEAREQRDEEEELKPEGKGE